jgi:hypothetical protein
MTAQAKLRYPGKVALRHALDAARAAGIDVGAVEVSPDGSIRIIDARAVPKAPADEFERWEGRL